MFLKQFDQPSQILSRASGVLLHSILEEWQWAE
jgi:hypothetical protein